MQNEWLSTIAISKHKESLELFSNMLGNSIAIEATNYPYSIFLKAGKWAKYIDADEYESNTQLIWSILLLWSLLRV